MKVTKKRKVYSESDRKTSPIIDKTPPKEGVLSPPTPVTIMIVHILNHIGVRRGGGEGGEVVGKRQKPPKIHFFFSGSPS